MVSLQHALQEARLQIKTRERITTQDGTGRSELWILPAVAPVPRIMITSPRAQCACKDKPQWGTYFHRKAFKTADMPARAHWGLDNPGSWLMAATARGAVVRTLPLAFHPSVLISHRRTSIPHEHQQPLLPTGTRKTNASPVRARRGGILRRLANSTHHRPIIPDPQEWPWKGTALPLDQISSYF